MTLDELKNYGNWIGSTAEAVWLDVLKNRGWRNVFPGRLPEWASKVRNFFNLIPATLELLPDSVSEPILRQSQKFAFLLDCHATQTFNKYKQNHRVNPWGKKDPPPLPVHPNCPAVASDEVVHMSNLDRIGVNNSLTKFVYKDEYSRMWFQMAPGSTIYHYGNAPSHPKAEAVYVELHKTQEHIPVFKLVSPDNTGGSHEMILRNDAGTLTFGLLKKKVDVGKLLVREPQYQGSYNYSDTTQVGLAAHTRHDIDPHVGGPVFYVNPQDPSAMLRSRLFPDRDNQRQLLVNQK